MVLSKCIEAFLKQRFTLQCVSDITQRPTTFDGLDFSQFGWKQFEIGTKISTAIR